MKMADRVKHKCLHVTPVYYGLQGMATRGEPTETGDWYYVCCFFTEPAVKYRKANTVKELCEGCKHYYHVRRLTKEEIRERYYS